MKNRPKNSDFGAMEPGFRVEKVKMGEIWVGGDPKRRVEGEIFGMAAAWWHRNAVYGRKGGHFSGLLAFTGIVVDIYLPVYAIMVQMAKKTVEKRNVGGRPAVLMPCGWCGEPFPISELRGHAPKCPKRGERPDLGELAEPAQVFVRMEAERLSQFERAAKRVEKTVADWLHDLGVEAIAPPAPRSNARSPIERDFGEVKPGDLVPRKTAAEIAASIPGVNLCIGQSFDKSEQLNSEIIDVGDMPVEEVQAWFPELQRLAALYFEDPSTAIDELQTQMHGKKAPGAYASWYMDKKVMRKFSEWLDKECPKW